MVKELRIKKEDLIINKRTVIKDDNHYTIDLKSILELRNVFLFSFNIYEMNKYYLTTNRLVIVEVDKCKHAQSTELSIPLDRK